MPYTFGEARPRANDLGGAGIILKLRFLRNLCLVGGFSPPLWKIWKSISYKVAPPVISWGMLRFKYLGGFSPPLWKLMELKSVGSIIPNIWKKMFQTTNQWYMTIYVDMYSHLPTSPVARRQNQYISMHKPYLWGELSKATVKRFSSRQAGLRLWSGLPVTKLWWKNTTSFVFRVKNRISVIV